MGVLLAFPEHRIKRPLRACAECGELYLPHVPAGYRGEEYCPPHFVAFETHLYHKRIYEAAGEPFGEFGRLEEG